MKSRGQRIFILATLILSAVCGRAVAQDAGMSDVEMTDERNIDGDKMTFTPGEDLRYVPNTPGLARPQDSVALQIHDFPMQRAAQKSADKSNEKQGAKKDDSILTFNFLYYIIQKYKLQDIID
jgi:hypothetical protein